MNKVFINFIKKSLISMEDDYTSLSRLRFKRSDNLSDLTTMELKEQKIQERPFAYEFYHQARSKWPKNSRWAKNLAIQGEVNKYYQYIPHLQKCPDFLIHHKGGTSEGDNFAVLEFKIALTDPIHLRKDIEKLAAFGWVLHYQHLIEVLIGNERQIDTCWKYIKSLYQSSGKGVDIPIIVLGYDPTSKTIFEYDVTYYKWAGDFENK